jgi:hypothetical protein
MVESDKTGGNAMALLRQKYHVRRLGLRRVLPAAAGLAVGIALVSCAAIPSSVFNPAFVDILDAEGTGENATVENAPGHIPVVFVNRTTFSPQLINYLEDLNASRRLSGTDPTAQDLRDLRPRMRVQMLVAFDNGSILPFEFVDGDGVVEIDVRDTDVDIGIPDLPTDPRLTENDLTRLVASCDADVVGVSIVGNPQVFVPVFTRTIRVEVGEESGEQTRILVATDPPGFTAILRDEVDADLNVTLLRNYGVREAPAAAEDLRCGTMVGIRISGTVSVPWKTSRKTSSSRNIPRCRGSSTPIQPQRPRSPEDSSSW